MSNRIYAVFARIKRGDTLQEIGAVQAANAKLARVYAHTMFDEENFVDMVVVPREELIWVRRVKGLFAGNEGQSA